MVRCGVCVHQKLSALLRPVRSIALSVDVGARHLIAGTPHHHILPIIEGSDRGVILRVAVEGVHERFPADFHQFACRGEAMPRIAGADSVRGACWRGVFGAVCGADIVGITVFFSSYAYSIVVCFASALGPRSTARGALGRVCVKVTGCARLCNGIRVRLKGSSCAWCTGTVLGGVWVGQVEPSSASGPCGALFGAF